MLRAVLLLALLLRASPAWAGACEAAAAAAEQAQAIPPGLLRAIGVVESGRAIRPGGPREAWPWAVGEPAQGRLLGSAAEAVQLVLQRQAQGARNIDVGCFQINLMHHPTAFATLEEAFDAPRNAAVAARFLRDLYGRLGSWEAAAAAYHSSTPERGAGYFRRVQAVWRPDSEPEPAVGMAVAGVRLQGRPGVPIVSAAWMAPAGEVLPRLLTLGPVRGAAGPMPRITRGFMTPGAMLRP